MNHSKNFNEPNITAVLPFFYYRILHFRYISLNIIERNLYEFWLIRWIRWTFIFTSEMFLVIIHKYSQNILSFILRLYPIVSKSPGALVTSPPNIFSFLLWKTSCSVFGSSGQRHHHTPQQVLLPFILSIREGAKLISGRNCKSMSAGNVGNKNGLI